MKKIFLILFLCGCENTITDNSSENTANHRIVINEINYHSPFDSNSEDWVELYNPTNETIDISTWKFYGDDAMFIIPENTILLPNQYIVLCENSNLFSEIFPNISNFIGNLGFGLKGSGELLRLFDSDDLMVDEVEYDDISPWPETPDGQGPTLELIDSLSDNALGGSWGASNSNGGTPGEVNSVSD